MTAIFFKIYTIDLLVFVGRAPGFRIRRVEASGARTEVFLTRLLHA